VATFDVEKIQAGQDPIRPIRGDDLIVVQRDPPARCSRIRLFATL
jgi:hypothetical protein